jgi:hypothetical protein
MPGDDEADVPAAPALPKAKTLLIEITEVPGERDG